MRALTLLQPWATAIACGMKRIETRGWTTPYRGPLLIHSSKLIPPGGHELIRALADEFEARGVRRFPLGSVVALAELEDIVPVSRVSPGALERRLGNYSAGRWAWVLSDVRPVAAPVECRGAMGVWRPRGETLAAVRAALSARAPR